MAKKSYEIPDDCGYTRSDEWVRVDGTLAHVGLTDYAQSELSDIVFVEFPDVGAQLEAGEAFGVVESVKAVSDLLAPVTAEVIRVNEALGDHPEWVNEDPYGRGWLIVVEPEDLEAIDSLMSPDDYRKYVEERATT